MPKSIKDLFLDKDYSVPFVEAPNKPETFISADIINSEKNPKGPVIQLAKNLPSTYGTDLVRIESKGSIDPARTMAVRGAKYNDDKPSGFGLNLGNLLGGDANRPSDTIFENKTGAPVSKGKQPVNGNWSGLQNAVDADKDYLVSHHPTKGNFLTGILKGNNPKEMAQEAIGKTIGAAQNLITKGINNVLTSNRKKGTKTLSKFEKTISENYYNNINKSSEYIKNTNDILESRIEKRGLTSFDSMRDDVLNKEIFDDKALKELITKHTKTGVTYLSFRIPNGNDGDNLVLPTSFTGEISETINAEWSDHKYVGSPFKNYRYQGVSRELKVSFNVYWLTDTQQSIMQKKLNRLRSFAFPDTNLATITLGTNTKVTPLVFSPNILKFSLGDYYKNLNVIVSNVIMGIPQSISWANTNSDLQISNNGIVYPTVVNVSLDMKIIETGDISADKKTITFRLDDMNEPNGNPNSNRNTFANGEG
jgi:hypothetical protein